MFHLKMKFRTPIYPTEASHHDVAVRPEALLARSTAAPLDPKAPAMIVCCCKAVSSQKIADLIAQGAASVEAIGALCGAGTDCGSCRTQIEEMLEDGQSEPLVLGPRSLRVFGSGSAGPVRGRTPAP